MPLDSTHPADKTTVITCAFTEIGRTVLAMLPKRTTSDDRVAVEYSAASLVSRLGEAWRDKTKRAAVAAGVLPDHVANPRPVGTVETVYTGDGVAIALKVVEQANRVDVAGLMAFLERGGVKPALLKRGLKKYTRTFPGAHIYTATLG